jgi:hypothetical protein
VIVGLATTWIVQGQRLAFMAARIDAPLAAADAVAVAEAGPILVFHTWMHPTRELGSWVFFAPLPDPALADRILWVRTLDSRQVATIMRAFPDRRAYRLRWVAGQPLLDRIQLRP